MVGFVPAKVSSDGRDCRKSIFVRTNQVASPSVQASHKPFRPVARQVLSGYKLSQIKSHFVPAQVKSQVSVRVQIKSCIIFIHCY